MQKIATRIFIIASLAFGVLGILIVLIGPENDNSRSALDELIFKSFMITVFIILPSFALSVAGKYLNEKTGTKDK
jgi:Na+/H+ antiporter NhaA